MIAPRILMPDGATSTPRPAPASQARARLARWTVSVATSALHNDNPMIRISEPLAKLPARLKNDKRYPMANRICFVELPVGSTRQRTRRHAGGVT